MRLAANDSMLRQLQLLDVQKMKKVAHFSPKEFKVVALRECPTPEDMQLVDRPEQAVAYWREHIATAPFFDPEVECLVVLLLNTRRRVKGHHLVAKGTVDSVLISPVTIFRAAVVASASFLIVLHNHPSGQPDPSEADIKVTRDLIRAGQLLKIEVKDHVIVGATTYFSLREHGGYFYQ